jgi:circularin A/uberolysin family circular bacteriocin
MLNSLIFRKLLILTGLLFFGSITMLYLVHLPMLAGSLGISTASASQVVNLISAYGTASFVISMIGAATGVGSIGSGVLATVLYIIKKKGKAKAALW